MTTAVSPHPAAGSILAGLAAREHRMYIGGEWCAAASGATMPVLDPGRGAQIAAVPAAGAADVAAAVDAARAGQAKWAALAPAERARLLWRLGDLVEEHGDQLARLDALDNGKPLWEAQVVDVPLTAGIFRFYAGLVQTIAGSVLPISAGAFHTYTRREPVGVVGAVVPWNFPLLMCGYKMGPSLAAGNAIVLKPAEQTPLSALLLAGLVEQAGFPAGTVNVITGDGPGCGAPLVGHPGVDKVTFTGSTEVGREIAVTAGRRLVPATLELGGKSPNVIFADADMEAALGGAHGGIFFNQGQCCVAGSRLLVEASVFDEVVERLSASAAAVRLGHGLDEGTQMGPLVSAEQRDRVSGFVRRAMDSGASVSTGGGPADVAASPGGYFFAPTVITGAGQDAEVVREEVFGPVVCATPFGDEDEAIALANDTPYGLAAGVWTTGAARAHRVAAAIDAGTVWVNTYGMFDPAASYGGRHLSGHGRELGIESLDPYLHDKTVWLGLS